MTAGRARGGRSGRPVRRHPAESPATPPSPYRLPDHTIETLLRRPAIPARRPARVDPSRDSWARSSASAAAAFATTLYDALLQPGRTMGEALRPARERVHRLGDTVDRANSLRFGNRAFALKDAH